MESTSGSPQKKALLLKKNVVRVSAPITSKASVKVTCKPVAASVLMTKPIGLKRKIKLIGEDVTNVSWSGVTNRVISHFVKSAGMNFKWFFDIFKNIFMLQCPFT